MLVPCAFSALVSDWLIGRELDRGRIGLHTLFVLTELFLAAAYYCLYTACTGEHSTLKTHVLATAFGMLYGMGTDG